MNPLALLVAGMAYGDESKGACVDFLCRQYGATQVVRYNGGPNAGHNVVLADGTHHTFSQFGSGSLIPGVKTHLSQYMLVNPISQMAEAEALQALGHTDIWERTTIHKDCVIITPFHTAVNRELERRRGANRHGSVGRGVGVARELSLHYPDLVLRAGDLKDPTPGLIYKKLMQQIDTLPIAVEPTIPIEEMLAFYKEWPAQVVDGFEPDPVTVFEGAQGFLLDEKYGVAPYNSWTNCTFENALALLDGFNGRIRKIGCFRTYFTRHGAGPFRTEIHGVSGLVPKEMHNCCDEWQGQFRIGAFDLELAARAISICNPGEIALSHCDAYGIPAFGWANSIAGVPISIRSFGPTAQDRKEM